MRHHEGVHLRGDQGQILGVAMAKPHRAVLIHGQDPMVIIEVRIEGLRRLAGLGVSSTVAIVRFLSSGDCTEALGSTLSGWPSAFLMRKYNLIGLYIRG